MPIVGTKESRMSQPDAPGELIQKQCTNQTNMWDRHRFDMGCKQKFVHNIFDFSPHHPAKDLAVLDRKTRY
jgi:hypothetical protein